MPLATTPCCPSLALATILGAALVTLVGDTDARVVTFDGAFVTDRLASTLKLFTYLTVGVVFLYSREAKQEDRIRGVRIPAGSLVTVCPYVVHRHKQLWDEPLVFRPERFLPENEGKQPR